VVRGPDGKEVTARTDALCGLVVRDVAPGNGYRVTVGGAEHAVKVMSRDAHPSAEFYAAQKLAPTNGYIKTRDGTLPSYRVVLPDLENPGPGRYDLVITYSAYHPGIDTEDGFQD